MMRTSAWLLMLLLCVAAGRAAAELEPEIGIEEMARRAPLVIRGVVESDLRVHVLEPLKGVIFDERIVVSGLEEYNGLAKTRWDKDDHRLERLRGALGLEACDRLAERGLVGEAVVLFLEPDESEGVYRLCGRTARFPKSNYEHMAIRVIVKEHVLRIHRAGGVKELGLDLDSATPTLARLMAAIRYERPLLLQFGYATVMGGGRTDNYFYFALMNLTDKSIAVDLAQTLTLTISGQDLDEETTMPRDAWRKGSLVETLEPGQRVVGQYRLSELPADAPALAKGESYTGRLTIAVGEREDKDTYTATATATIR